MAARRSSAGTRRSWPPVMPYTWALAAAPVLRRLFQGDLERLRDLVVDPAGSGAA